MYTKCLEKYVQFDSLKLNSRNERYVPQYNTFYNISQKHLAQLRINLIFQYDVGIKTKGQISKRVFQENKARQNFPF